MKLITTIPYLLQLALAKEHDQVDALLEGVAQLVVHLGVGLVPKLGLCCVCGGEGRGGMLVYLTLLYAYDERPRQQCVAVRAWGRVHIITEGAGHVAQDTPKTMRSAHE